MKTFKKQGAVLFSFWWRVQGVLHTIFKQQQNFTGLQDITKNPDSASECSKSYSVEDILFTYLYRGKKKNEKEKR